MPLNAAKLASQREEFDWNYLGEPIHIVYNPQGFTPEFERKIQESFAGQVKSDGIVYMLKEMLVDWDLVAYVPEVDENGNEVHDGSGNPVYASNGSGELIERPLGTSTEALVKLPVKFLSDVVSAIAEEIQGAVEQGQNSGAGSPQTGQ